MAKTTVPQYLSATTSIIDSGDATAITIDGSENVAIGGGTNHDGAALLVSHGDSGVTTFSDNADELVIENSTNAGISILTPNNASGSIIFGDSDDDDIGKIVYNHNDNSLTFTATTVATSGNASVGGTLGVTGVISPTTHIDMPDNAMIKLGTGDDLQLWHDGTNNIIRATGDLLIQRNTTPRSAITITDSTGAVDLAYGGSTKLATASDGVDVTGTLDVSGAATVSSINASGGYLNGANGGIRIHSGGTKFFNVTAANAARDNHMDIGASDARFKDLYLGGSITVGDGHTIGDDGDDNLTIASSANENIIIDSADDIILDTGGDDIKFKVGGTDFGSISYSNSNLYLKSAVSNGDIIFQGNDGGSTITAMAIDMSEGGRLGIGTSSPGFHVDIQKSLSETYSASARPTALARVMNTNTANNNHATLEFGTEPTSGNGGVSFIGSTVTGSNLADLFFGSRTGASTFATHMTIKSDGKVGIGTTSPDDTLDIMGGAYDQIRIGSNKTDNTAKACGIVSTMYTNNSVSLFQGYFANGANTLYYGSADGAHRGINTHIFYVNANYNATTSHTEAMRIDSSGNFYVSTTNSSVTSNTGGHYFDNAGYAAHRRNSAPSLYLNRFGTEGLIQQFHHAGTACGSISVSSDATAFNTSSDARLKNVLGEAKGLDIVNQLNPVHFEWKETGKAQDGLIAQEVEPLIPYAVIQSEEDGYYQMDYSKLVTPLIKAVQEQQEQIEELKAKVQALESS